MEPITKAILALVNDIQLHQRDEMEQCRGRSESDLPVHTVAEFFVLRKIGEVETVNASALAKSLRLSKSGVSKITGRFLERGLICAGRRDGNEKEVYYSLTESGKRAYAVQQRAGREKSARMKAFLAEFDGEEQRAVLKFLTGIRELL
jgi:DNA-binding MarR family transcriptional regulator